MLLAELEPRSKPVTVPPEELQNELHESVRDGDDKDLKGARREGGGGGGMRSKTGFSLTGYRCGEQASDWRERRDWAGGSAAPRR